MQDTCSGAEELIATSFLLKRAPHITTLTAVTTLTGGAWLHLLVVAILVPGRCCEQRRKRAQEAGGKRQMGM